MRLSRFVAAALLSLFTAAAQAAPTAQDLARVRAHSGYRALVAELRQCTISERAKDSSEAWRRCFNRTNVVGPIIKFGLPAADAALMLDNLRDEAMPGMDALRQKAGTNVADSDDGDSVISQVYAATQANTLAFNKAGKAWAICLRDAALVAIPGQPSDDAVTKSALGACAASERAFAAAAAETKYRYDGYAESDRRARIAENGRKMRASLLASLPTMRANPARFK